MQGASIRGKRGLPNLIVHWHLYLEALGSRAKFSAVFACAVSTPSPMGIALFGGRSAGVNNWAFATTAIIAKLRMISAATAMGQTLRKWRGVPSDGAPDQNPGHPACDRIANSPRIA